MRSKKKFLPETGNEPLGIVISDGGPVETNTRFAAYIWGPVPDVDDAEELALAGF